MDYFYHDLCYAHVNNGCRSHSPLEAAAGGLRCTVEVDAGTALALAGALLLARGGARGRTDDGCEAVPLLSPPREPELRLRQMVMWNDVYGEGGASLHINKNEAGKILESSVTVLYNSRLKLH